MSNANAQNVDPAVEEVLASIRKIMSDDGQPKTESAPSDVIDFPIHTTKLEKLHQEDADVLDLTEMINNDGSIMRLSQGEAKMADIVDDKKVEETQDTTEAEGVEEEQALELDETAEVKDSPAPEMKNLATDDEVNSIMSPEAVAKSAAAFADLEKLTSDMKKKISDGSFGSQTLDELMRELLRPILKEWLDAHLPSLVKWLVAEKIEQMMRERNDAA